MSLDKFIRLADSVVEFEADLNDHQFPVTSIYAIEVHQGELKSSWTRIKAAYEEFLIEAEKEAAETENPVELESIKVKYRSTYTSYCSCLAKLGELSDALQSSTSEKLKHHQDNLSPGSSKDLDVKNTFLSESSRLNLPPVDIEPFHGDYLSWPTFRDIFTAVISNSRASNVEKLFYLTKKTTGEAREIVQKCPLTNEGFNIAWENLCSRYENRRVLVNGQLKSLFGLQSISSESSGALKRLQRDINSCISILRLYSIDVTSWDPIFVFICTGKIPENTLTLWEQQLKDKTTIPKWSDLDNFLTNRYRTLESVSEIRGTNTSSGTKLKSKSGPCSSSSSNKAVNNFQANVSGPFCQLCPKENHAIRKRPKFLKLDHQRRLDEIKTEGLCLNCFSGTHGVRNCTSKNSCFKCQKRHNTLLHKDANTQTQSSPSPGANSTLNPNSPSFARYCDNNLQSANSSNYDRVQSCFTSYSKNVLLGTAMVDICHKGVRYQIRALIDSGSEGTFISERLCNRLKLSSHRSNALISGLNNTVSVKVQRECSIVLGTQFDNAVEIPVTALVVPNLTNNLPTQTIPNSIFSNLPHIKFADPKFYVSSKIDLLIGADIFPSIVCSGMQHNVCDSLIAQETIFGWILTGPIFCKSRLNSTVVSYFCEISLDKEISRFWEVENLPQKNFPSQSDRACEELFVRTTSRNSDGRYIVSLPFREEFPESLNVGHSRSTAMAQFYRNEARLIRNPELKTEYDRVVQEYEDLGHMEKVNSSLCQDNSMAYYLPHHAVIKPDSVSTKVRVVFNASAPSSNGNSLNSLLHVGPTLQNDLTLLILKWRFFKFVFNADIQKMYRQILVDRKHTPYQRILFRDNPSSPILDYELKTVSFGVNCAPYLAIRTLLQLADDVEPIYPFASTVLRKFMYVDDILAGAHTKEKAVETKRQLIQALQSAGFLLRKWTSNSSEILSDLPPDHLLHEHFLKFEDNSTAKTLGIRWNARSDEFYFAAVQFSEEASYTKREVLSQIAKLFHPAGWLAPCIVQAKILMQSIWKDGTGWDEVISPDALNQWKLFQANYSVINTIRIPRWINYNPNAEIQFHGFCDASEKAYAAALYVRIADNCSVHTHLISSKTKVAPVKTISIPRLELCGAVLLSEMIESLIPQLDIENYSIFCWTDSTIVLSWLAKPPCSWLTFVANRVSKITQVVVYSQWHHVNSEANPADLASRGRHPQDLVDNELWWYGPQWLRSSSSEWPRYDLSKIPTADIEAKPVRVLFSYFSDYEDILERFSSFHRAIRVMSYVYRFIHGTHRIHRDNVANHSVSLSTTEIKTVRSKLISICQRAHYPNEYKALSDKHAISKSSTILNLNPFLDPEGVLRSCGRLESSTGISYNEKYPIILPYNTQFSRLLVRFIHEISLHGGNQLVLRLLRTEYWIPKAKNLIKTTINKCKVCVIYKKRCQKQIMAALPPERSEITRPFTHTGLDFAGPFDIKSYSGRACRVTKGYVCIFVCFSTKAIHLEATSDLSTQSFLAAFSRFVSRRGCPLHLHSDNGTTFVGASKILAKEFILTSQQRVISNYAHQNISWHFIPAGAPHMGGLWEAGVKSFKLHFRKMAGVYKYTFEEFLTLLTRIESCLNSRPISSMSTNPEDLSALTPGHFLIGSPILAPVDPQVDNTPISLINRWQRLKFVYQNFCTRWKTEYLKE